jgi:membrane-associated phospholipid phosphatase
MPFLGDARDGRCSWASRRVCAGPQPGATDKSLAVPRLSAKTRRNARLRDVRESPAERERHEREATDTSIVAMTLSKGAVADAVAWPGEAPQGRYLPAAVSVLVAMAAGPRAAMWTLGSWGIVPIGEAIKQLVHRPRPFPGRLDPRGGMSQGPSFPSTHVSKYVAVFGFASWVLWRRRSVLALPAVVGSAGLIALVGPGRITTGDHRPSDVVAGYVVGAAFLGVLVGLASRDRRLRARNRERRNQRAPATKTGLQVQGRAIPPSGRAFPSVQPRPRLG